MMSRLVGDARSCLLAMAVSLGSAAQTAPPPLKVDWSAQTAFTYSRTAMFERLLAMPVAGHADTARPTEASSTGFNFQTNLLRFLDDRELFRIMPDPYMIYLNKSLQSDIAWAGSMVMDAASLYLGGPLGRIGALMHAAQLNRIGPNTQGFENALTVGDMGMGLRQGDWAGLGAGAGIWAVQHQLDPIARQSLRVEPITRRVETWTRTGNSVRFESIEATVSYEPPSNQGRFQPAGPFDGNYTKTVRSTSREWTVSGPALRPGWNQTVPSAATAKYSAGMGPTSLPAGWAKIFAPTPSADWGRILAPMPRADWSKVFSPTPRADWGKVFAATPQRDWSKIFAPKTDWGRIFASQYASPSVNFRRR